jgi:hypothetical protein
VSLASGNRHKTLEECARCGRVGPIRGNVRSFFVLTSSNCRCRPEPALRGRSGGVFQGFSAIFDQFWPIVPVQKSGMAKQTVDATTK